MGLGLKKRAREIISRATESIMIPKGESYWWAEKTYAKKLFELLEVDCVYDVGANRGQYGKWLRSTGYSGPIISFEPNPSPFAELEAAAAHDPSWSVHQLALGAERGSLPLNVTSEDSLSSFLKPRQSTLYGTSKQVARTVEVPVETLSEMEIPFIRPFLKMDTQGFDLQVLAGARDTINSFSAMVSEISFTALYEGSANYAESIATIQKLGFVPAGVFTVHPYQTLQLLEANAYFVRQDLAGLDPELQLAMNS